MTTFKPLQLSYKVQLEQVLVMSSALVVTSIRNMSNQKNAEFVCPE